MNEVMSHVWMSHATHMNASCHMCKWITSYLRMSHVTLMKWVMSHVWNESCHTCNTLQHTATHCSTLQHTATHCSTLQHTSMSHVWNESCHTYEQIMPHKWMKSCHTYESCHTHEILSWVCLHCLYLHIFSKKANTRLFSLYGTSLFVVVRVFAILKNMCTYKTVQAQNETCHAMPALFYIYTYSAKNRKCTSLFVVWGAHISLFSNKSSLFVVCDTPYIAVLQRVAVCCSVL